MAGKGESGVERRKTPRFESQLALRCKKGNLLFKDYTELRDISQTGVRFSTPEPLLPGDVIQIDVPSLRMTRPLTGKVLWAAGDSSTPGAYMHGARFVRFGKKNRTRVVTQVHAIEAYRAAESVQFGRDITSDEAALECSRTL